MAAESIKSAFCRVQKSSASSSRKLQSCPSRSSWRSSPVPDSRRRRRSPRSRDAASASTSSQIAFEGLAALIVDEFVGQQEIVVKQFDGVNGSKTLFSGATILGDGSPALIVDASSLL